MNMALRMNKKTNKQAFISIKDWITIIALALIGMNMNELSYNNTISILLQGSLLGVIFVIYRNRPSMFVVAYLLLSILPVKMYGGFIVESGASYYTLNSTISTFFLLVFVGYEFIVKKRKIKYVIMPLLFLILIVFSYAVTISRVSYNMDFWWRCLAYVFIPLFIKSNNDIKVILTAHLVSIFAFNIKVLPILSTLEVYRGWLNLDPNYASFFLLTGLAITLTIISKYKDLSVSYRFFLIVGSVLSIITMSFFASRTGFIMLGVLIILNLFFTNKRSVKTLSFSIIAFIIGYMILNHFGYFDNFFMRMQDVNTGTAGGRIIIQRELLKSFYQSSFFRFLFGYGFLTANNFGLGMQAHNTYVSILTGFGIVGFSLYIYYLSKLLLNLIKTKNSQFLILFWFLVLYGFSLEPYHMIEGVILFCLLGGATKVNTTDFTRRELL